MSRIYNFCSLPEPYSLFFLSVLSVLSARTLAAELVELLEDVCTCCPPDIWSFVKVYLKTCSSTVCVCVRVHVCVCVCVHVLTRIQTSWWHRLAVWTWNSFVWENQFIWSGCHKFYSETSKDSLSYSTFFFFFGVRNLTAKSFIPTFPPFAIMHAAHISCLQLSVSMHFIHWASRQMIASCWHQPPKHGNRVNVFSHLSYIQALANVFEISNL